jgi:ClpP class serine protease
MIWLLQESVRVAMESATPLSAAQIDHAMAAIGDPIGRADRVLSVSGDTATINIAGVMTKAPSFMAYFFGGGNVLYGDLDAAIDAAEGNPAIKNVDFVIESGGGEAQPAADLGDRIAAISKPTRALVKTAGSAAYWAASQADSIVALSRSSRVGSIGAATIAAKPSESSSVSVTSTNAPNKRPNPETEEGLAAIRSELDQFHELFATAVAVGRDKGIETVNNTFGRGGMMLADQALAAGMIDAVGVQAKTPTKTPTKTIGATTMDLATLQAEHPALLAQVQTAARAEGAAAELDRVKFHALMGQKTGATAFALQACLEGKGKDDTECQVEYMTFGRNNSDLEARSTDEQEIANNNPAAVDESAREVAAVANIFERVGG